MIDFRKILRPDDEGHYSSTAQQLDADLQRRFASGSHPIDTVAQAMAIEESRRRFFSRGAQGIGALALASLLGEKASAASTGGIAELPHFPPKAKRCIYLH